MVARHGIASVVLLVALIASVGADPPSLEDCTETKPDPNSMQFCDGGIQSTCEMIDTAPACTGTRKDRRLVTQNCVAGACDDACKQLELVCWIEYQCVWDQGDEKCENGEQVGTATTMAKANPPCKAKVGCNQ